MSALGRREGKSRRSALPKRFTNCLAGAASDLVGEIDIPALAMKIAAARAVATLPRKNLADLCAGWRLSWWIDRYADISDASALSGPRIASAGSRKIQMNHIRRNP
jgi:hypothetical protein